MFDPNTSIQDIHSSARIAPIPRQQCLHFQIIPSCGKTGPRVLVNYANKSNSLFDKDLRSQNFGKYTSDPINNSLNTDKCESESDLTKNNIQKCSSHISDITEFSFDPHATSQLESSHLPSNNCLAHILSQSADLATSLETLTTSEMQPTPLCHSSLSGKCLACNNDRLRSSQHSETTRITPNLLRLQISEYKENSVRENAYYKPQSRQSLTSVSNSLPLSSKGSSPPFAVTLPNLVDDVLEQSESSNREIRMSELEHNGRSSKPISIQLSRAVIALCIAFCFVVLLRDSIIQTKSIVFAMAKEATPRNHESASEFPRHDQLMQKEAKYERATTGTSTFRGQTEVLSEVFESRARETREFLVRVLSAIPVTETVIGSVAITSAIEVALSTDGKIAFVGGGSGGLKVVNVTTLTSPTVIGSVATTNAYGVTLSADGNTAFVADVSGGVKVINVTILTSPTIIGSVAMATALHVTLSADGKTAFVGGGSGGLKVVNVTTLTSPTTIGSVGTSYAQGVVLSADGKTAFVGDNNGGVKVINVTTLTSPTVIVSVATGLAYKVALSADGKTLFAADNLSGLKVINVTCLTSPTVIGTVATTQAHGVTLSADGNTAFVADLSGGLKVIDVTTPSSPTVIGSVATTNAFEVALSADGKTVFVGDVSGGLKVISMSCSSGYYLDFSTYSCPICSSGCSTCSSASYCNSCSIGWWLNPDSTCQITCPSAYYQNSLTNLCSQCPAGCSTCANAQFCGSCSGGYFLDMSTSSCPKCPAGCSTCSSASYCNSCSIGWWLNPDSTCQITCPSAYYQNNSTNLCSKCPTGCSTCANAYFCGSCFDGYFASIAACFPCDSSCATCNGTSSTTCLSCKSGSPITYLNAGRCESSCSSGFYSDSMNICQPCNDSCKTCFGPLSTDCVTCAYSFILDHATNSCSLPCLSNQFQDGISSLCQSCDPSCNTCNGSLPNQCTSCNRAAVLDSNNSCVATCPTGYFENVQSGTCECGRCEVDSIETNAGVQAAQAVVISAVVISVPLAGLSGLSSLWPLLAVSQMIYYLLFLKLNFPSNLVVFLRMLSFTQFPFLPNILKMISNLLNVKFTFAKAPTNFDLENMDRSFLTNAGGIISTLLFLLMMTATLQVINNCWRRKNKHSPKILLSLLNKFKWGVILRYLLSTFMRLTLTALLQVSYSSFETVVEVGSLILGLIVFLFVYSSPALIHYLLVNNRDQVMGKGFERKFGELYSEFASDSAQQKLFQIVVVVRKLCYVFGLVFCYDNPLTNIIFISVCSFLMIILIAKIQPYRTKAENVKNIIQEVLWITGVVLCSPFAADLEDETSSVLGVVVIAVFCGIILLNNLFLVWRVKIDFASLKEKILLLLRSATERFSKINEKMEAKKLKTVVVTRVNRRPRLPFESLN